MPTIGKELVLAAKSKINPLSGGRLLVEDVIHHQLHFQIGYGG